MIKRIGLAGFLAVLIVTGIFAGGHREAGKNFNPGDPSQMKAELSAKIDALEKIKLTGQINLTNRIHPELNAGGQIYLLFLFPWLAGQDLNLKNGDTISVEAARITAELAEESGYLFPGRMGFPGGNREFSYEEGNYLLVTGLTVNGETYNLKDSLDQLRIPGRGGHFGGRGMMDCR